jgi:hypothetical protein
VTDLEQREARARELHARVDHVLREGSAELDVRHSDLIVRSTELERREAALAEAEARVEDRARAFGAVELKAAAVERRERALREREEALARYEQAVRAREEALVRRAAELELAPSRTDESPEPLAETSHVALTIDNGYRLLERDGAPPATGDSVELDSVRHLCVRVTSSPYPNDRRRCAVLERVEPQTAVGV